MTRAQPEHPSAPLPGASGDEPPHDVLAAEEFPGPSPDATIHAPPVQPPPPPDPDPEPHDVLAAEQFAGPAPRPGHELTGSPPATGDDAGARGLARLAGALAAGVAAAVALRLVRRRRGATGRRTARS